MSQIRNVRTSLQTYIWSHISRTVKVVYKVLILAPRCMKLLQMKRNTTKISFNIAFYFRLAPVVLFLPV